jgi:hypothetical protein
VTPLVKSAWHEAPAEAAVDPAEAHVLETCVQVPLLQEKEQIPM